MARREQMIGVPAQADDLFVEVATFERGVTRRNLRESLASCVVAIFFLYIAAHDRGIHRIAALFVVAAALHIPLRIHLAGRALLPPLDRVAEEHLRKAFAQELNKQSALLDRVLVWYVGPMALSTLSFQITVFLRHGIDAFALTPLLLGALLGSLIVFANKRASRRLRERAAAVLSSSAPAGIAPGIEAG